MIATPGSETGAAPTNHDAVPALDDATSSAEGATPAPRRQRPLWRRALFPLGMLGAAFGIFWVVAGRALTRGDVDQLSPEAPRGSTDPNAVAVTVAPVVMRPVQRTVEAVGTFFGYEEVSLRAKVEGRVKRVVHDVADRVAPGEPLFEIDPVDAELAARQAEKNLQTDLARLGLDAPPQKDFDIHKVPAVAQAEIRLANARGKLERASALAKNSVITSDQLAERSTEFKSADAELANQILIAKSGLATIQMRQESLAIVQQQLADTVMRAPSPSKPVPGTVADIYAVTKRSVAEGSFVQVGDEVCRLAIDRTLKLRVAVPERHSPEVKLGQKAKVFLSTSDVTSTEFAGEVSRINPAIDQTTRTFEVEILVANDEGQLKPGGFAKAAIATRLDERAATVPLEALVTFAGISKIFLKEGDRVRDVHVSLGVQRTDWVEIARPSIPDGSQVVTSGQTKLAEGSTVFVRPTGTERIANQPEPAPHAN